jgi:hypothetical protein
MVIVIIGWLRGYDVYNNNYWLLGMRNIEKYGRYLGNERIVKG